jgi:hypothetical protein
LFGKGRDTEGSFYSKSVSNEARAQKRHCENLLGVYVSSLGLALKNPMEFAEDGMEIKIEMVSLFEEKQQYIPPKAGKEVGCQHVTKVSARQARVPDWDVQGVSTEGNSLLAYIFGTFQKI